MSKYNHIKHMEKLESLKYQRSRVHCTPLNIIKCMFVVFILLQSYKSLIYYLTSERSFVIDNKRGIFLKDGEPFRYISGSMHYFRIPRIYWKDRIMKAKAAGLDAIQIYIPWNFHEPNPGEYVFYGERNVVEFISLVQELELLVLVRLGPYVCGEWDFGGLPAWLLSENSNLKIRSSDPDFLRPAIRWFNKLLPLLKPLLYQNGGPIIMIQVENEYGSFPACDGEYLTTLYEFTRFMLGSDIILYSTDGPSTDLIQCGSSDRRIFTTIDFGINKMNNLTETFSNLEAFQPNHPLVNSEFYSGWLDHWGEKRHTVDATNLTFAANSLLNYSPRVSFNIYMFHGGTNFGYWNGANAPFDVTITSYDYDAPISEAGDITNKFVLLQQAFFSFKGQNPPPLPVNITKANYGTAFLRQYSHLLYKVSGGVELKRPNTMEAMKQYQGFMVYTTSVEGDKGSGSLSFDLVKDVGHVFTADASLTDLIYHGSVSGNANLNITVDEIHSTLAVITECQGHINFGKEMLGDVKGIIGEVRLNSTELFRWTMVGVDVRNSNPIQSFENMEKQSSVFPDVGKIFQGTFYVSSDTGSPKDTFAKLNGFTRGILLVNDEVVGRFNPVMGPQVTLYVPANFLRLGENVVKVMELERLEEGCRQNTSLCSVTFLDYMIWL